MDIEINEVQEIIKNLESGGEISIKDGKYLKVAKLCVQLAAENVALEKAQQSIDSQREYYEGVIADGGKRIAELESRTVKLPQRYITQFRKGFDDYYNEMVYKADEVLVSLAAAGIEVEAEKIRIVLQELKEDGVLTTYSNGHVEMLPYRIDENGEEYVEMFPNDIELH